MFGFFSKVDKGNQIPLDSDYHTHSTFSVDGRDTPAQMCQAAVKRGVSELALTEHAEWIDGQQGFGDPDGYFEAIAACRHQFDLRLLAGVELGNPHQFGRMASQLLTRYDFDVTLGSLHWLYNKNIHDSAIFIGRSPQRVFRDYFAELARMVQQFEFDVVAHFDRIYWRAKLLGIACEPRQVETPIRNFLQLVVDDGRALELNTRRLNVRHHWRAELLTMLTWYHEQGGRRLMINSDAHTTRQIQVNLAIGKRLFAAAGFSEPARMGVTASQSNNAQM